MCPFFHLPAYYTGLENDVIRFYHMIWFKDQGQMQEFLNYVMDTTLSTLSTFCNVGKSMYQRRQRACHWFEWRLKKFKKILMLMFWTYKGYTQTTNSLIHSILPLKVFLKALTRASTSTFKIDPATWHVSISRPN